jgi:hypothetical protein
MPMYKRQKPKIKEDKFPSVAKRKTPSLNLWSAPPFPSQSIIMRDFLYIRQNV